MIQMDYQEFNKEGTGLRRHQVRMLEMMLEIDKICRKHEISYWLASGTALGAVRHQGFIPWDDDLDIEVLREDYRRLLDVLSKELPYSMCLQTSSIDQNYIAQFAKVRDLKSEIVETDHLDSNYKYRGVFIDIFPMERTNVVFARIAAKLHYYMYKLAWAKNDKWGFKLGLQMTLLFVLERGIYPFFRLFSFLSSKDTLRHPLGVGFFSKRKYSEIFPLKEKEFEGYNFFVPCNLDAYLTRLYGDYMKMPPINEIKQHIIEIKFK